MYFIFNFDFESEKFGIYKVGKWAHGLLHTLLSTYFIRLSERVLHTYY